MAPLIGIQMLLWSISGAYMVLTDIDDIHGDHLVAEPVLPIDHAQVWLTFASVKADYPDAMHIRLKQTAQGPVYFFKDAGTAKAIHATTGEPLTPPNEADIRARAQLVYTSNDPIAKVSLYEEQAPAEMSPRLLPLYRVDFDAPLSPSLYFSANTGELVGKRYDGWRLFDFLWMLHIMDYAERENIHNNLLRIVSLLSLLLALTGAVLAWRNLRPAPESNKPEATA
ncbi:PepSY domain-containing protein [Shewanella litorisediminis]|uniref:PepSY domain-containing protein n=1 Tax=Shewanella litorisediminis TaxID=1173586 RepID=A0ABX7G4G6_9GAMM|nr:PepSY domain-containing protein [Shewanella litorisediminis]